MEKAQKFGNGHTASPSVSRSLQLRIWAEPPRTTKVRVSSRADRRLGTLGPVPSAVSVFEVAVGQALSPGVAA